MATKHVVILGAGFGGLELASRLSAELADAVHVTLIDKTESFMFGYSKLDVMFGRHTADEVRLRYRDIAKPGVEFRQEVVESIDPVAGGWSRRAAPTTPTCSWSRSAPTSIRPRPPVCSTAVTSSTRSAARDRLRDVLPAFDSGDAVIGVLGPFFKCPAAPFETAMMLHDLLEQRGKRGATTIKVLSPMGVPIPISKEASAGILGGLAERGIEFWPESVVTSLDPKTNTATLRDGRTIPYDLFLGVPVHRAPAVVEASGLTEDGWIPVDHTTFATRFPDVYAVGDITSAPVPRVGVIAEGEAGTVADVLVHRLGGGATRAVPRHRHVLHRVRRSRGREIRRQLPRRPVAVRRLQRAVTGHGRLEDRIRETRRRRWFGA